MAKRKYKKNRASKRSAWETYNYWYDKYTKGNKAGWFREKYTKKEFEENYKLAKMAKIPNPAKAVAQSQEYVDRKFERQYKEMYGKALPDIRDKSTREKLFTDFVDEMRANGMSYEDARNEFETYFY